MLRTAGAPLLVSKYVILVDGYPLNTTVLVGPCRAVVVACQWLPSTRAPVGVIV